MVEKISNKLKSPYTAAMTGCGFMWKEMTNILPLLMSPDSPGLLKQEIIENKYLMMNTEHTRKKAVAEFIKRFNSVPLRFWQEYQLFSPNAQIVAIFNRAVQYYRAKAYTEAVVEFKKALAEPYIPGTPYTDAQIYSNIGMALSSMRLYAEAYASLMKAREFGLDNPSITKELLWLKNNCGLG